MPSGKCNFSCPPLTGIDQGVIPPPIGPTTRPDVSPVAPGTHLLFVQSGKIEHIPLDGYSMNKGEAKALLHLPVRLHIDAPQLTSHYLKQTVR